MKMSMPCFSYLDIMCAAFGHYKRWIDEAIQRGHNLPSTRVRNQYEVGGVLCDKLSVGPLPLVYAKQMSGIFPIA